MDVRLTPYSARSTQSTLAAPRKTGTKTSYFYGHDQSQVSKSIRTLPTIQAKKTRSINNNSILVLSKKNISKPQFSIRTTSSVIQPATVADKKGVLLYQQVERNKLFSNQSELVNRFNYRV